MRIKNLPLRKGDVSILFPAVYFLILFGLYSCKVKTEDKQDVLNFEEVIGNKGELKLSEIASSVEYIRLETSEDCLIGGRYSASVFPSKEYLLVRSSKQPVLIFRRDGTFLTKIGSLGRGPGEYFGQYTFSFDEKNDLVFILTQPKGEILKYDIEGNFLAKIVPENNPIAFGYLGNNLFCCGLGSIISDGTEKYNYIVINSKGETVRRYYFHGAAFRSYPIQGTDKVAGYQLNPSFTSSAGGIDIYTGQNDTIFTLDDKGDLTYSFAWDLGKYRYPFYKMDPNGDKELEKRCISTMIIVGSTKHWFIQYFLNNESFSAVYDKQTGEYFELEDKEHIIKNDIDGGPGFWFTLTPNSGLEFAHPISVAQLLWYLEKDKIDNNVLFPEKARALKDLIETLDENDNPVIGIVRMK